MLRRMRHRDVHRRDAGAAAAVSRRALLVATGGVLLVGGAAGCRDAAVPAPRRTRPAAPTADQLAARRVTAEVTALLGAQRAALAELPLLAGVLQPLIAQHTAHLTALRPRLYPTPSPRPPSGSAAGTATASPPPTAAPVPVAPTPGAVDAARRRAALAGAEAAASGRVSTEVGTVSGTFARVLASISAAMAVQGALLLGTDQGPGPGPGPGTGARRAVLPSPPGDPAAGPLPAGSLRALQAALAAEHAAVYAYGALGAVVTRASRAAVTTARTRHLQCRDLLAGAVVAAGAAPAVARPAYGLPRPLTAAGAIALAAQVEDAVGASWADVVAATTGGWRQTAAQVVTEDALRAAAWRGAGTSFPGLGEYR